MMRDVEGKMISLMVILVVGAVVCTTIEASRSRVLWLLLRRRCSTGCRCPLAAPLDNRGLSARR
jgi:hypothetical protein